MGAGTLSTNWAAWLLGQWEIYQNWGDLSKKTWNVKGIKWYE